MVFLHMWKKGGNIFFRIPPVFAWKTKGATLSSSDNLFTPRVKYLICLAWFQVFSALKKWEISSKLEVLKGAIGHLSLELRENVYFTSIWNIISGAFSVTAKQKELQN